jgi:flagellar motor switch protein FliN/FliY
MVNKYNFDDLNNINSINQNNDYNKIKDIDMEISVELGKTTMSIDNILNLQKKSVIELDKLIGDDVEIKANDKIIAKGEVVTFDDKFGVRITKILKGDSYVY